MLPEQVQSGREVESSMLRTTSSRPGCPLEVFRAFSALMSRISAERLGGFGWRYGPCTSVAIANCSPCDAVRRMRSMHYPVHLHLLLPNPDLRYGGASVLASMRLQRHTTDIGIISGTSRLFVLLRQCRSQIRVCIDHASTPISRLFLAI